jgi:predicted nucleotidyltransferase
MNSVTKTLCEKSLITPPDFLKDSISYEVIMGSVAYGVSTDESDTDIYGFCIPPKEMIFPHLSGQINGFGRQKKNFGQFQAEHVKDEDIEYDIAIYNIVKYFNLCMENNPNMIDSLFVDNDQILYIDKIGQMVRDRRHIFLHKGCWQKFRGYACSQLGKLKNGPNKTGNRKELIQKFGYDVKAAYHAVRLLEECRQILTEGDLHLKRSKSLLKSIRNGEATLSEIEKYFFLKETYLEEAYKEYRLQNFPNEAKIKELLVSCLEEKFGNLSLINNFVKGI